MVRVSRIAGNVTDSMRGAVSRIPRNTGAITIDANTFRKMESPVMTKLHGDTITNSSFYKANKRKLAAAGITTGAVAAWYGSLIEQGYSPTEAWEKMSEDIGGIAGSAGSAVVQNLWNTFVQIVHNAAGHKVFDSIDTTERVLKYTLIFLVVYRFLSLFGINLFKLF